MSKEELLSEILEEIANQISITPTMIDKAEKSYKAVGEFIAEGINYNVKVSPQGSMNLGTAIKPISNKDDYDIDLVCMLENGQKLSAKEIKNIVGDRLKEHKIYKEKIDEEGEGKRCWKMQYDEFHMDILPCVPQTIYLEPDITDIRITNKNNGIYEDRYSNPYGYKRWFEEQTKQLLNESKRNYAIRNKLNIDDVPTYRVKTPLQLSIQLLKRHRDMCFKDDLDNKPISIIITTLAAKAYQGQDNIYDSIKCILENMDKYIENRNGTYFIKNPVKEEENFADKWILYPERKEAFFKWLKLAKRDLIDNPIKTLGLNNICSLYKESLGDLPVQNAFNNIGNNRKELRESNKLFFDKSTNKLVKESGPNSKLVPNHAFYGEK